MNLLDSFSILKDILTLQKPDEKKERSKLINETSDIYNNDKFNNHNDSSIILVKCPFS